jgi:putative ABC transport system ATP-binding protein
LSAATLRMPMIHFEEVTKVYQTNHGPVTALGGLTLDVEPGQFVAVRGPSGCGKSTLLTIAGGLGSPTSGRVVVADEDLGTLSAAARARFRARKVGFVFQTFHLLPYLSVLENVTTAALPGRGADARRRARQLLERFQLDHRLGHRPGQLSTGECQRVAIARAMINEPRLILADEPTGNLDPDNAQGVLELLAQLNHDGCTILLVTHQDSAVEYASRCISLRDGSVVAD